MKQYKERIKQILTDAGKAATRTADNIDRVRKELEKANADLQAATLSGNPGEYLEAEQAKDKAEKSLEMLEAYAAKLTRGPLIDYEAYTQLANEILDDMSAANAAAKKEVVELCEKVAEICRKNQDAIEATDALLYKLQHEVYRDADMTDKNGNLIPDFSGRRRKQFTDRNSLTAWAVYALWDCAQYNAVKESVEPN